MTADNPRAVLDHIVESISPASAAQAAGARARLAGVAGPRASLGDVEALAARLAGARHAPSPAVDNKSLVICAADHGVADPGVDLGHNAPTIIAVQQVVAGEAAVNAAARTAGANLVIVDCGIRGAARVDLGPSVLDFRVGDGSGDIRDGTAMTLPSAVNGLQTGIALTLSLADGGLDLLAIGAVATGGATVSGAVIAAVCGNAADFGDEDRDAIDAALAARTGDAALELLVSLGGPDIAVLAGLILGAAAINVPVVLDDHLTWAAALIAAGLAPAIADYLIASHAGASPPHRAALTALGLEPLFDLGISHGEGTGAALALPFVDAAAGLLAG